MLIDTNIVNYFSNEMIFVKAHAEAADSLTAKTYSVSGFPTFVIIDSKGKEIDRIVGYMPAEDFLKQIDDYMNGIGTLDDLLAKAEAAPDRSLYFEIADKYKYRGGADEATTWFKKVIAEGEPTDSLSGEARFALADMKRRNKEFDAAIAEYKTIKKDFNGMALAETAGLYIPYATMKKGDTANAIIEFEKFIKEYPESEDVEYATKKIGELKGETTESK